MFLIRQRFQPNIIKQQYKMMRTSAVTVYLIKTELKVDVGEKQFKKKARLV